MNQETVKCSDCGGEVGRYSVNGYGQCGPCAKAEYDSKHFTKDFELQSGDRVKIVSGGRTYTGVVINSPAFWGEHHGWYIEFTHDSSPMFRPNLTGQYGYWKQGCDGGTVEKLTSERAA